MGHELRYYVSTKYPKNLVYFSIEEKTSIYNHMIEVKQTFNCIRKMEASSYMGADGSYRYNTYHHMHEWKLDVFDGICRMENSIMLHPRCRAYGIGTLMLHTMLQKAKACNPDASLRFSLSPVDEKIFQTNIDNKTNHINNAKLRDSLYENLGMKKVSSSQPAEFDYYEIGHLRDLTLKEVFSCIQEISYEEAVGSNASCQA